MRRALMVSVFALLCCSPALAWDLNSSKEPETGIPLAFMTEPSSGGEPRAVATFKCRGGTDPRFAFALISYKGPFPQPLRVAIARDAQLELQAGSSPFYPISSDIDPEGTLIETGPSDQKSVSAIAAAMASGAALTVKSPLGSTWSFRPDKEVTRKLLSVCGISAPSPASLEPGTESLEEFTKNAKLLSPKDRTYREEVFFRTLVLCAVNRIANGRVTLPLGENTTGQAAEGECSNTSVSFLRYCTLNSHIKNREARISECWDRYRAALLLIDTGRASISDFNPSSVQY
ncbi:hypothetical protein [Roseixanthobacter pseudopolyaromaticivorans]|uniref:hypothetical protein n=1 Tax=Xanthobacteraceae TaxID=335928 RepID=UPI003727D563